MQIPFELGKKPNGEPFYYVPVNLSTQSESVFIYGTDEDVKTRLIENIVSKTIDQENAIWILFGHNVGYYFDIQHYKVPFKLANRKTMAEYFQWYSKEEDIYNLVWERMRKEQNPSKSKMIDTLNYFIQKFGVQSIQKEILKSFDKIEFNEYSDFGMRLKNAIEQKDSQIFSFDYTCERSKTLVSFIIEEIRKVVKNMRLKGNGNHVCILCDHSQWLGKSLRTRRSMHDAVFSWGRTFKVTRFIVERGNSKTTQLLQDTLDEKGSYGMVFETVDDKINHVNRISVKKNGIEIYYNITL